MRYGPNANPSDGKGSFSGSHATSQNNYVLKAGGGWPAPFYIPAPVEVGYGRPGTFGSVSSPSYSSPGYSTAYPSSAAASLVAPAAYSIYNFPTRPLHPLFQVPSSATGYHHNMSSFLPSDVPPEEVQDRFEAALQAPSSDQNENEERNIISNMMNMVSMPNPIVAPTGLEDPSSSSAPNPVSASDETLAMSLQLGDDNGGSLSHTTQQSCQSEHWGNDERQDTEGKIAQIQNTESQGPDSQRIVNRNIEQRTEPSRAQEEEDDDDDDDEPFIPTSRARRMGNNNINVPTKASPKVFRKEPVSSVIEASKCRVPEAPVATKLVPRRSQPKSAQSKAAAVKSTPKRSASSNVSRGVRKETPSRPVRDKRPVRVIEDSPLNADSDSDLSGEAASDASGGRQTRRGQKRPLPSAEDEDYSASDYDENEQIISTASNRRDNKEKLIASLLSRWWYALPEWPPAGFDYQFELRARKCKQISFDQWEEADDVDAEGFTKVYEITHFPGMYRDPKGAVIDLRPQEGKPCYSNLSRMSEIELTALLAKAIRKQIEDLEHSPYRVTDEQTVKRLKEELVRELKRLV
eukprot:Gregarina_sp_Poly_1__1828@NODE_1475_length_4047_cov_55_673116_g978_i0_p1_GENE_NODE_1475_length_4047_cov_55_673116_g978_i0NODE_1475_length_4047_cov_55_673116_g978_i0_p1_ORF_typecomplete_len577_score81_03DUF465/PF04325_13/0_009PGA2/PF07543_12/59PGA2/PF07543_12/0_65_NODE_1475_length_4047_cov_55_673116_g978_i022764006